MLSKLTSRLPRDTSSASVGRILHSQFGTRRPSGATAATSSLSPTSQNVAAFSSYRRTVPLQAKVELLSLGGGDENTADQGMIMHVLPVGSSVKMGEVVAMIRRNSNGSKDVPAHDDSDSVEEQVAVYAPLAGRIRETYFNVRDPVSVGDHLMDIDDSVFQEGKALQDHVQNNNGLLSDEFLQSLLKTKGNRDAEIFRLQVLVQSFPPQLARGKALPIFERLLELQTDAGDGSELAKTNTQVGVLFYNLGDMEMALQHLNVALSQRKESLGKDHPQVAATHIHLGALYRQAGDMQQSLDHMKAALDIQKEALGDKHPLVASSYNNIGALHYQMMDFARAIREYEKALSIHQEVHGEMHPGTAGTYHNLGVAWKHLGDFSTALEYLQKALHVRQQSLIVDEQKASGTNNDRSASSNSNAAASDVASSHTALGQLFAEMANDEAAMEQYEAALSMQQKVFGADSPVTAVGHNNKGAVLFQQGNYADALQEYQTGLNILLRKEPNHPDTASSWNNVGLAYLKMGQLDQSLEHHQEALKILTLVYGGGHPNLATTIGSIGNVYKAQEKWEEALGNFETAHDLLVSALGTSDHPDVASSFNNIGLVLTQMDGRHDEALEKYRAASSAFEKSVGPQHPHVGSCRYNIGLMLQSRGMLEDAKSEFEAAREIWEMSLGLGHAHTEMAQKSMEECR